MGLRSKKNSVQEIRSEIMRAEPSASLSNRVFLALTLLSGIAFAANLTGGWVHLGYGSQDINGVEGDAVLSATIMAGVFILGGVLFIWMATQMGGKKHE